MELPAVVISHVGWNRVLQEGGQCSQRLNHVSHLRQQPLYTSSPFTPTELCRRPPASQGRKWAHCWNSNPDTKQWPLKSQSSLSAWLTDSTETDFYDDRTHCLLKQKDPRLWSSSRQSQVPRLPRGRRGRTGAVKAALNHTVLLFISSCFPGSASLAQRHALPHTLLSRSLRHDVSTIADIHLLLLQGDEEGHEVGAVAAGRVENPLAFISYLVNWHIAPLLTPSGSDRHCGHSNRWAQLSCVPHKVV